MYQVHFFGVDRGWVFGIVLFMTRILRKSLGGVVYHVMNRANAKSRIFRKRGDFVAFEKVLGEAIKRTPCRLLSYCIMGNHWHLLLRPYGDGDLSEFVRWLTVTHVRRWHSAHGTVGAGHLYQGRFKSFPVQSDGHYLTAVRYIESNPVRAGIVEAAEDWEWSSLAIRNGVAKEGLKLAESVVELPRNWGRLVNLAANETDLAKIEKAVKRGCPLGDDEWVKKAAKRLGLEGTLKPMGRPRKAASEKDKGRGGKGEKKQAGRRPKNST